MRFQKVALIGVGLLGGSLGLALRQRGLAGWVSGYVRRPEAAAACRAAGAVDEVGVDLAATVQEAELVIFCTPVGQMRFLAEAIAPRLCPGTTVTDVGSVKAAVVRELEPLFAAAGCAFVGSHPMAGSEQTGVAAARADLFRGAVCVVTPTPASDPSAATRVEGLWQALEGRVLRLPPETHDELVAYSSHLPLAVAAVLARLVLDPEAPTERAQLCAGGFRDTTRIASGSPEMWRDILLANRAPVLRALSAYVRGLDELRAAVETANATVLTALLTAARERREAWLQSPPAESRA